MAAHRPDVVVMDLRMRRVDGIEATRRLRRTPDAPPVLVLTTFDDDELLSGALRAGAPGSCSRTGRARSPSRAQFEPSVRHQATCWPRQHAVAHAAQRDAAEVRRGVEVRHECLQRVLRIVLRRRDALDDQVEQRPEALPVDRVVGVESTDAQPAFAFV